ncbi:AAA family ATPase [Nocardia sp. NPDC059240]|uniref:AAA family ATPase n=1 Tax=Nocardia sp. NPDC059240 TaxID=3346786 RepID=UPI0036B2C155
MVVMLRIHIFGALEVELDGDPVPLPRGRLIPSLLAWLALHPGPHPRTRVCAQFWPDAPDPKARASLRNAVWTLRTAFGPNASALRTDRDTVELRRDAVWVDAVEFDRLRAAGHAEQAITLCRGDLLTDHDEEWARRSRDDYAQRLATLLAVTAQAAESGGNFARARVRAHRRATLRPLDEEATRELIRLSAADGDLPAALTAFTRLRDALRSELDVEPAAATRALINTLRPPPGTQHPTLPGIGSDAPTPATDTTDPATPAQAVGEPATTSATPGFAGTSAVTAIAEGVGGTAGIAQVRDIDVTGTATAATLYGRTAELHALTSYWHRARDGAGMVAALSGDGGIGKTRLAEEMLTIARRDGARTAIGAPGALGGAPYELWSELLAEVLEPGDRLPEGTLWAADLARLLPGVAAHLGLPSAPGSDAGSTPSATTPAQPRDARRTPPPAGTPRAATQVDLATARESVTTPARPDDHGAPTPLARATARGRQTSSALGVEHDRIRLFESVVELLGFLAARRPLAVALEDLQAADLSSLELLRYVGRRLSRVPVLVILTRRPMPPRPQVDGVLGALRAKGALRLELALKPLAPQAIRSIVREAARLPAPVENRILAVVDGNPLLATETARHVARGAGDPADGLRVATGSAMARLSESARLFLDLAAAAGRDLTRGEVLALPLLPDPAAAATESLGAGLLRVREDGIGYRHESLRQAVYDEIPQLRRVRLHDALAASLHERGTVSGQRRAVELARHLRLAGHRGRAATELRHAATAARAVAAMTEAAEYLRQAVELDPENSGPLLELAEIEAWRGLPDASDTAFDRALGLIPTADAEALVDAWLRRGRWLRGGVCHPREARRSYRAALDVLERVSEPDPLIRVEALAGMAWAEAVAGDPEVAAELLCEVDVLVHGHPLAELLTHDISFARAHVLLRVGRFTDSYGPLIAAAHAAGRAGRPDMAYACLANAAGAAACAGDFERALDFVERCLPLVVPTGLTRLAVYSYTGQAAVLRRLGRTREAATALSAAEDAANRLGIAALEGLVHAERAQLALCHGEFDTAVTEFRSALDAEAPISRPLARLFLAEALARAGRSAEAEAEIEAVALEPMSDSDFPDTLVARMNRVQGLLAAREGDDELAIVRLRAAAAGWRRRADAAVVGRRYAANIIDLGRPPLSGLVEPEREYRVVTAELAALLEPASSGQRRAPERRPDAGIR